MAGLQLGGADRDQGAGADLTLILQITSGILLAEFVLQALSGWNAYLDERSRTRDYNRPPSKLWAWFLFFCFFLITSFLGAISHP
jgi:hypothetical protein